MKRVILYLLVISSLWTSNLSYAQPKIPKEKIPTDIPVDVKEEIERLYSKDPIERRKGVYHLGEMGQKAVSAAPFLIGILENEENLNNENAKVLISTLLSLGKIKDPRAIDPLIKVLVSKDMDLQPWAMAALQNIGEPAVEPLITILKEKDTHVQAWAQDALVAMGEPAVEHLIIAIRDKDINVRANAAFALGRIKDNRAMEPLIVALKDEDAFVRRSAEIALAWVKDPRAVEPLIEALKDKDTYVQQFAAKALKAITGQNFGQNPAKWQEWWEKNKGKIGREK